MKTSPFCPDSLTSYRPLSRFCGKSPETLILPFLNCKFVWTKEMAPLKKLSDEELMALLREGDHAAFREIFLRYDKLLFLYAFKKLREREEARDVVQEVFAWLWNNRQTFDLKTTLAGFLYKSVLNKVFDIFRHQDIIRQYAERGNYYIDADHTAPDYLIREKDIQEVIEREIAALPPRMREIYELRRKGYLTTREIAGELHLSEHTVSTQLKRAVKQLKLKLGVVAYVLFLAPSEKNNDFFTADKQQVNQLIKNKFTQTLSAVPQEPFLNAYATRNRDIPRSSIWPEKTSGKH
jgi:RNA polymerase sigma-70 factor (family 1)